MKFFMTIIVLLVCISAGAQRIVSGTVTDVAGDGLYGVTIQIKGTNVRTTADFDGNYKIAVEDESVLVFTSIGYQTKEMIVGSQKIINMTMYPKLEVVMLIYNCFPAKYLNSSVIYGTRYNTLGAQLKIINTLPLRLDTGIYYATDTFSNHITNAYLQRPFYLGGTTSLLTSVKVQQADFNKLQFHKYTLETSTFVPISKKLNINAGIELGHLNYDFSNQYGTSIGYGLTLKENMSLFKTSIYPIDVELKASLTNWNEFVEKQAGAGLYYNSFSINGQYQWLGDYEEFTLSAGYRIYF